MKRVTITTALTIAPEIARSDSAWEAGNERVSLQAREQKYQTLDDVDQEVPEKDALQARGRTDQAQAIPTDVEARRNGRQDA
jgi:hypothetical protein